jgi:hypothetical protein
LRLSIDARKASQSPVAPLLASQTHRRSGESLPVVPSSFGLVVATVRPGRFEDIDREVNSEVNSGFLFPLLLDHEPEQLLEDNVRPHQTDQTGTENQEQQGNAAHHPESRVIQNLEIWKMHANEWGQQSCHGTSLDFGRFP